MDLVDTPLFSKMICAFFNIKMFVLMASVNQSLRSALGFKHGCELAKARNPYLRWVDIENAPRNVAVQLMTLLPFAFVSISFSLCENGVQKAIQLSDLVCLKTKLKPVVELVNRIISFERLDCLSRSVSAIRFRECIFSQYGQAYNSRRSEGVKYVYFTKCNIGILPRGLVSRASCCVIDDCTFMRLFSLNTFTMGTVVLTENGITPTRTVMALLDAFTLVLHHNHLSVLDYGLLAATNTVYVYGCGKHQMPGDLNFVCGQKRRLHWFASSDFQDIPDISLLNLNN